MGNKSAGSMPWLKATSRGTKNCHTLGGCFRCNRGVFILNVIESFKRMLVDKGANELGLLSTDGHDIV